MCKECPVSSCKFVVHEDTEWFKSMLAHIKEVHPELDMGFE